MTEDRDGGADSAGDEVIDDNSADHLGSESGDDGKVGPQVGSHRAVREQQPGGEPDNEPEVVDAEPVGEGEAGQSGRGMELGRQRVPVGDQGRTEAEPSFIAGQLELFHATSGPLPDVRQLRQYGELDPSYPERIMRMAEASSTDVSARADKALDAEIRERKTGQIAAIVLAFVGLASAIVFAGLGHYGIAALLLSVPFVLLVRALIGDAVRRYRERHAEPDPEEDSQQ